jgi:hypothetical protein
MRISAAVALGVVIVLAAAVLAFVSHDVRWLGLAAVGAGLLTGAIYIGVRQRRGPLDWDQHFGEKNESNFHHL